ncbi:winged helix-turn-helix transcriptional regulator [Vibrio sp. SM6]|uniref:Winged helix-turn-helix transcriptional regulator n=1 Tax=Vibrio agarilyticus TaxID=2726741 RepID=A0A7X8TNE6_9VIBR|nr:winged helix-turn-helix domain-containing protein [Vibrio agarilyticus]NLS11946.1 winged helix-turn-helix transcriptional regulator [Vibrio agarilyticus]
MNKTCASVANIDLSASEATLLQEQQLAMLAKALAHPARVRILKMLLTLDQMGGCLNSDLVSELGLAQSTVSEHLRILKQAGFITAEAMPPKVCYRINREQLSQFSLTFDGLFG